MKFLKKYNKYIKGEMTEKEMDSFTTDMLKEHYKDQQLKQKWKKILDNNQDLSQLKEKAPNQLKAKHSIWRPLMAAASLLLLISAYFMFQKDALPTHQQLVKAYTQEAFPYNEIRKSIDDNTKLTKQQLLAGELYTDQEYQKSIIVYKDIVKSNKAVTEDKFYLALDYFYLKKSKEAIPFFKEIIEDNQHKKYKKESTWYLSLSYLQMNDFDNASILLNKIVDWESNKNNRNRDKIYITQAKTLLEAINNLES